MISLIVLVLFVLDNVPFSRVTGLHFGNRYKNFEEKCISRALSTPTFYARYIQQKVDHFNPTDDRVWNQKYYFDGTYYRNNGPVYLWIEGEAPAHTKWLTGGFWKTHGKKMGAMFFLIEHRFYGDSQPLGHLSTENLRYLTTSQALADIAAFIVYMNRQSEFPEDLKWIVFGGSYAGNLAAWVRIKYPHLVYAAVASSAPVLAQYDFPEYLDAVGEALASYKTRCKEDVGRANEKLDNLVRTKEGRKEIGRMFKLCSPLRGRPADVSFFACNLVDYFTEIVQYDRFGGNISSVCDKLMENAEKEKPIERYANTIRSLMKKFGESCISTNFTEMIEFLKKTDSISSSNSYRAWWYQTCTEYGYYQTSNKKNYIFSKHINLEFYTSTCWKVFGHKFTKNFVNDVVNDTNTFFGGLKIDFPRILFVHGSIDPWHALGIISAKKKKYSEVIYIKGGSHCSDLRFPTDSDSDEVIVARERMEKILNSWLE